MKKGGAARTIVRLLVIILLTILAGVLAFPSLRRELVVVPLQIRLCDWRLASAKTAADEKAAIESATQHVRIWHVGPANRDELPAYQSGKIPKVIRIEWAERKLLTGDAYLTTHRLISESNWAALQRGNVATP